MLLNCVHTIVFWDRGLLLNKLSACLYIHTYIHMYIRTYVHTHTYKSWLFLIFDQNRRLYRKGRKIYLYTVYSVQSFTYQTLIRTGKSSETIHRKKEYKSSHFRWTNIHFNCWRTFTGSSRRKEIFHLTTHSTHFIYGYMASGIC